MHIVILGGTGRTGRLVIAESLARGHTVTALVRDASALEPAWGLVVVQGSPQSATDIGAALDAPLTLPNTRGPGCDDCAVNRTPSPSTTAVIQTLNNARASDSPFARPVAPPHLLAEASAAAAEAMRARGVKKFIGLSAFGVGDSRPQLVRLMRCVIKRSNMSVQFADHEVADEEVRGWKDLKWVLARPVMLKDGGAKEVRDFGNLGKGAGMLLGITRSSLAQFLVDAAEGDKWDGRTPVIAN